VTVKGSWFGARGEQVEPLRPVWVAAGEIAVSAEPGVELVAAGLGSCVAVCLWDPMRRGAGMAHVQLPEIRWQHEAHLLRRPYAAAERAVPMLVQRLLGVVAGDTARAGWLRGSLVGGAAVAGDHELFGIAAQNVAACQQQLQQLGFGEPQTRVGGASWRTARLRLDGFEQRPFDQILFGTDIVFGMRRLAGGLGQTDCHHLAGKIPFIQGRCHIQPFIALQPDQAPPQT